MKKNKRKIIIIVVLGIILIISVYILIKYSNMNKNVVDNYISNEIVPPASEETGLGQDEIINTSEKLKEEKTFEGLVFNNISIVQFNGSCTFEADVINNTGKDTEVIEKDAVVVNEQNEEIARIPIYIDPMKKDGKTHVYTNTKENILPAMDFKIVDKK